MRMDDDTSGSETDITASDYSDYEEENEATNEEHREITARSTAVRAMDFRRGHRRQHRT